MSNPYQTDTWLRELLGGEPPPGVAALGKADQQRLASLVAQARARQAESLGRSFEATAKNVPWGLRRIVKKVLLR